MYRAARLRIRGVYKPQMDQLAPATVLTTFGELIAIP